MMIQWSTTRDALLLLGGLVLAGNEVLVERKADPQVLILAAGMMGLPGVLRADREKK